MNRVDAKEKEALRGDSAVPHLLPPVGLLKDLVEKETRLVARVVAEKAELVHPGPAASQHRLGNGVADCTPHHEVVLTAHVFADFLVAWGGDWVEAWGEAERN